MLFPEWFSEPHANAPAKAVFDHFPSEDDSRQLLMSGGLKAFLAAGDKPILIALANHTAWSPAFLDTGLRACALLGVRALVAIGQTEFLPTPLPSWIHSTEDHSFSDILPHVRAVVHNGDIGTLARCLAAGVPQLISPMLRGQQGNAGRVRWFGVGESLLPAQFSVAAVAASLLRLTSNASVRAGCDSLKALCRQRVAGPVALAALESIARGRWSDLQAGDQVISTEDRLLPTIP